MSIFKKCKVKNCENKYFEKGYCNKHYTQMYRYGKIMDEQWEKEKEKIINKKCKANNCENSSSYKNSGHNGYCCKHYMQLRKNGKILERTKSDPNEIINCGEYYEICLYRGRSEQIEVARTQIDKEDLVKVKNYKWTLLSNKYIYNVKNKILLHHLIFGNPPTGYEVDHRDTNPLNNRKYNLRLATHQQNMMNRKSKGYYWDKNRKKWVPQIMINYKHVHLGRFDDEQIAQRVAQGAHQKYFGKFAYKNK